MARRVTLPISDEKRLSLARAREKLGGRVRSRRDCGQLVQVVRGGERRVGVVVWSGDEQCDVWLEPDQLLRTARRDIVAAIGSATDVVLAVAQAAKSFGKLREGETVHVGGQAVTIVEMCRWGALVARPGGAILAMGFQRLGRATFN